MTLTKFQALVILFSILGGVICALFLVLGYFTSPAEGRINPITAALLTTGLLTASGAGGYIFWTSDLES